MQELPRTRHRRRPTAPLGSFRATWSLGGSPFLLFSRALFYDCPPDLLTRLLHGPLDVLQDLGHAKDSDARRCCSQADAPCRRLVMTGSTKRRCRRHRYSRKLLAPNASLHPQRNGHHGDSSHGNQALRAPVLREEVAQVLLRRIWGNRYAGYSFLPHLTHHGVALSNLSQHTRQTGWMCDTDAGNANLKSSGKTRRRR